MSVSIDQQRPVNTLVWVKIYECSDSKSN